jgi:hypothetical protein
MRSVCMNLILLISQEFLDFKQNSNMSINFSENTEYQLSQKKIINPSGCLMHKDRQTDRHDGASRRCGST